jgi:hypothetical protein
MARTHFFGPRNPVKEGRAGSVQQDEHGRVAVLDFANLQFKIRECCGFHDYAVHPRNHPTAAGLESR